jgi:Mn-dependent DtxR family transcriptional regulator
MITHGSPIDADTLRLRDIFVSTPTLLLTVSQTARLLDVRVDRAAGMLDELEAEGWLTHRMDGQYRLAESPLN